MKNSLVIAIIVLVCVVALIFGGMYLFSRSYNQILPIAQQVHAFTSAFYDAYNKDDYAMIYENMFDDVLRNSLSLEQIEQALTKDKQKFGVVEQVNLSAQGMSASQRFDPVAKKYQTVGMNFVVNAKRQKVNTNESFRAVFKDGKLLLSNYEVSVIQ